MYVSSYSFVKLQGYVVTRQTDDAGLDAEEALNWEGFGKDFDYNSTDAFDTHSHLAKRRRSGESPTMSIASRIESRFPSITRAVRERRRANTFGMSYSATPSTVPSRAASMRGSPTRTSSISSSLHQSFDAGDRFAAAPARSSKERVDEIISSVSIALPAPAPETVEPKKEDDVVEEEVQAYARTPLLPPMFVTTRLDAPTQSPLQSPTVADPTHSLVATPVGTPPVRAYPTPPLSTKPSVSSFMAPRPAQMLPVPPSDVPPMMLTDPEDKWADKLSHANFTILPEPYMPETYDADSLRQLFADWEQARCNFTKHLVRTGEHFGVTSKHYKLTEQKWAEIDATWKANNDLAVQRAAAAGLAEFPEPTSPLEPAPLSKMPTLDDPKSEGKFPKLGDEDIVGPMVQIASQALHKTPHRKRSVFKFFSDIKFPGSFLRRNSSGITSH